MVVSSHDSYACTCYAFKIRLLLKSKISQATITRLKYQHYKSHTHLRLFMHVPALMNLLWFSYYRLKLSGNVCAIILF